MDSAGEEPAPGQLVRIRTVLNETFDGLLLSFDQTTQCFLLQTNANASVPPGSARSVMFLRKAGVQELTVTGRVDNPAGSPLLQPPRFDIGALQAKESAAVEKAEEEAELLKLGVTPEALDLYAALSKTLPVAWDKTTIVVLGEIRISSPYLPQSVTGGSQAARDRVKMVVTRERERLQPRNNV